MTRLGSLPPQRTAHVIREINVKFIAQEIQSIQETAPGFITITRNNSLLVLPRTGTSLSVFVWRISMSLNFNLELVSPEQCNTMNTQSYWFGTRSKINDALTLLDTRLCIVILLTFRKPS